MGSPHSAYPFELTPHVAYVLKKIIEAHDDWGYASEPMYLFPYADGFTPTRAKDYNLALLFKYLDSKNILKIITPTNKDFYNWISTPIVGLPKMKVYTRWKLKVVDRDKVRVLQKSIDLRVNRLDERELRCNLAMNMATGKLYLVVDHKFYYLKKFNAREAQYVFRRLIIHHVVERDSDGYIKGDGVGGGMKIGSLADVIRNAGFKKHVRQYLFHSCKKDMVELKSPAVLDKEEINHILDAFTSYGARNNKLTRTKNRDSWKNISSDNPLLPS